MIVELDARGQIDSHAAMCLRFTIEDLLARGADRIVIDLRDLHAVEPEAIALLRDAQRDAAAAGAQLGLLAGIGLAHSPVTHALQRAGLRVQWEIGGLQPPVVRARSARERAARRSRVTRTPRG